MSPCCIVQGPGGVPDGGPIGLPPRGTYRGAEAEYPAGGGGPGRDHRGSPSPRHMSTATCDTDRGLADGADVHGNGTELVAQ